MRMAEADVESMTRDLKSAVSGTGDFAPSINTPAPELDMNGAAVADEIDALGRARRRAEHESRAESELEELKRRMGK